MLDELVVTAEVDDAGLDVYEFRVYARICRRGTCTESQASMAVALGISERKVRDAVKALEARGMIAIERPDNRTNSGLSNTMVPTTPQEWTRA